MENEIFYDKELSKADLLVLKSLEATIKGNEKSNSKSNGHVDPAELERQTIERMQNLNNPKHEDFDPTVINMVDFPELQAMLPAWANAWLLQPYVRLARSVVRNETDVVMLTHLIIYFTTSVPSAFLLFRNFTWLHGVLHAVMQGWYVGTYTLMMHQHIHQRGILAPRFWLFDQLFPYLTDPLMGHTWNTYFYHHVKHHHVEGNGPDDLSSTIRYQRDDLLNFLHYVGRFYFLIWLDLPLYFFRKGKVEMGIKASFWETSSYLSMYLLFQWRARPTFFVYILPVLLLRVGLMVGNWGQHAFVDDKEPDSDYRSSITLIDVPSNRHCYNDGYHTSHHLNPMRHWRDHPVAFLKGRQAYADQHALVFHNIDYIMITVRLMMKDYDALARCLVPINDHQINMTMAERAAYLRRHTRRFSEEEIRAKFSSSSSSAGAAAAAAT